MVPLYGNAGYTDHASRGLRRPRRGNDRPSASRLRPYLTRRAPMTAPRPQLIIPAVGLGLLLLVVAVVYIVDPAKSLPSFFPGHEAGSAHHHIKHGIAAFVVGVGCFVFAWFQSGPRRPEAAH